MNFSVIVEIQDVSKCIAILQWRDMAKFLGHYLFDTGYYGNVSVVDLSSGEVILSLEQ